MPYRFFPAILPSMVRLVGIEPTYAGLHTAAFTRIAFKPPICPVTTIRLQFGVMA